MDGEKCRALTFYKKQCRRFVYKDSEYCWQHRISRLGDARWYNNAKIQAIIAVLSVTITSLAFLFDVYQSRTGPTKENQKITHAKLDRTEEAVDENSEKLNQVLRQLKGIIPEDIKGAVEKIFLDILKEQDIPQYQWPEKLMEVAKSHQELLDKWQTFESVDPAVDTLRQQAHVAILNGDYDKAGSLFAQAVEIDDKAIIAQEENLVKRKVSKSQSLAAQANLSDTKLNFTKAIELYEHALKVLPASQKKIRAGYLNNLGLLYYTIAEYDQAELLYKQALAIDEASFGKDHPNIARDLNNLALLYLYTKRYFEAEGLYKRAVEIFEKSYGKNHPNVATLLNSLAQLYQEMNRQAEAERLYKRAMSIDVASFGKDHPNVSRDLNNLALLYQNMNRYSEAEGLYKRAMSIDVDVGNGHLDLARDVSNLMLLYQDMNQYSSAVESMMRWVINILEKSYGKNHPDVARALNNLAQLYQATNRYSEAEPLMKRVLAIDEASFGKDHPNVAIRLNNLAALYQATNRYPEAEPLMERALAIDEASFGKDHPNVARDLNNLAALYQATNRYPEAEPLIERALAILIDFTRQTSHQHPHLMDTFNNYAGLLVKMGDSKDQARVKVIAMAPDLFDQ